MSIKKTIDRQQYSSIKSSFFHIYHTFIRDGYLSVELVNCLFKWAIQLQLTPRDLEHMGTGEGATGSPDRERDLEHLFNLVYMIYLDDRVDDIELKVLSSYAEELGFKPHVVNDLLKDIATAPYDGYDIGDLKSQLREILEIPDRD